MRLLFKIKPILLLFIAAACTTTPAQEATPTQTPDLTTVPILIFTTTPTNSPELQPAATQTELDLREANVVAVEFEDLGDGRIRFDVTLLHDDDGEAPLYADWWQVETEDGQVLGRRVLTHSHGTQPFTRSETIEVPAGLTIVIVRGHDMQHEFGGQAMQVNLSTGETIPMEDTSNQ
jgi:hypothetical protein